MSATDSNRHFDSSHDPATTLQQSISHPSYDASFTLRLTLLVGCALLCLNFVAFFVVCHLSNKTSNALCKYSSNHSNLTTSHTQQHTNNVPSQHTQHNCSLSREKINKKSHKININKIDDEISSYEKPLENSFGSKSSIYPHQHADDKIFTNHSRRLESISLEGNRHISKTLHNNLHQYKTFNTALPNTTTALILFQSNRKEVRFKKEISSLQC